jgi:hypothetical protein
MPEPSRSEKNEPVFTDVVDRVIEFTSGVEGNLAGWKFQGNAARSPDRVLTTVVDQVVEFTDRAVKASAEQTAPSDANAVSESPSKE